MTPINEVKVGLVAIVDDDRRVLKSLENLLESGGFRTRSYLCAHTFLKSGTLSSICSLISDVYLPDVAGWELEEQARLERPGLPIIPITGNDKAFLKASGDGDEHRLALLRKPLDGPELRASVRGALAK